MIAVDRLGVRGEVEYEEFLARRVDATLYHSARYRDLVLAVAGGDAEYLVARHQGRIVGVLPTIARDGIYGRVINSLPFFGSYGAVLADDAEAEAALWTAFHERASMPGVASATVIDNPFIKAAQTLERLPATHRDQRIAQFTALDPGESSGEALRAAIDGSARRNLRKAEMAGVRVCVDNDALDFLEAAHRDNMAQIAGLPKPASFFAAVPRVMRANLDYRIYVATIAGNRVAALLVFYYSQFAEYVTPATGAGLREQQPMAAILHRAMCDAAAEGRRIWNWGGTWLTQTGVYRFKRKWGAQEIRYGYRTILNDASLLRRTPEELSAAYPYFYVLPFSALHSVGSVAS
jgi:hypothetical protein